MFTKTFKYNIEQRVSELHGVQSNWLEIEGFTTVNCKFPVKNSQKDNEKGLQRQREGFYIFHKMKKSVHFYDYKVLYVSTFNYIKQESSHVYIHMLYRKEDMERKM